MKRRAAIGLIAGGLLPSLWPLQAQSVGRSPRIVVVVPVGQFTRAEESDPWKKLVAAFLQGLNELGYIDGNNMRFEFYSAEGKDGQLDAIAARILETPPDVILAAGGGANEVAHAFKRLTRTVPIVMANSSDPVLQGLVADLARPGGNITGFSGNAGPQVEAKRLEFLNEVLPSGSRVGYLGLKIDWNSSAAAGVRTAAERLGMTIIHVEHTPLGYDDAFDLSVREKLHGLFVARNPWNFSNRRAITGFATHRRIAAVYPTREFAEVAGLICYGPSLTDLYRRAAGHADRILKGAKPSELPVEQPIKYEFLINLKTAQEMDLKIPEHLLAQADEIIE
ncbi:ABC transporter substrate-binding protein [Methylobacterium oryzisoli]|uniref:ABC transporter substrate-binding protein n=1 Tax=Methylobacterium oryzisoli TaxID=3385502 RepID=UPI003892ACD3